MGLRLGHDVAVLPVKFIFRHFMLNTRDKIFGSDIYDKKELWFGQKVLAAFLYQSLYGMHASKFQFNSHILH